MYLQAEKMKDLKDQRARLLQIDENTGSKAVNSEMRSAADEKIRLKA